MRNSQKTKRNTNADKDYMVPLKLYDDMASQVKDGRFSRYLNKLNETKLSWLVKFLGNLFFALILPLNYPLLVIAGLWIVEKIVQSYQEKFTLDFSTYIWVFIIYLCLFSLKAFYQQIQKNFVSREIHLIWAINYKGFIKNPFYSIEASGKYSEDFNKVLTYFAKAVVDAKVEEYKKENSELTELIKRLRELTHFPNDVFESLSRQIEVITDFAIDKEADRNNFSHVLDRVLSEMSSVEILKPLMKQATIMLINEVTGNLKIEGQYNIPNGVINSKEISIGDKFAGKVVQGKEIVWIPDVSEEGARVKYGFEENSYRVYKGIIGIPIIPKDAEKAIGVINLHSNAILEESETEKYALTKIIEPYAQLIVSAKKLC
ncbi:hypothetical protein DFO73_110179 [Cytobacillus oceanisediminis]|uniref:GAF domain-containing protein n=1 Tax=Cytobacillus oceanisediminis TaxID=665099 RepID=A0A2V2ZRD0_9BACI|nr:hypothetical protein [Cytobacillus oceanisediminis]PWW26605.1 hypothetical protein DFO73_110179 [Cytobacillus oceanisediminis]